MWFVQGSRRKKIDAILFFRLSTMLPSPACTDRFQFRLHLRSTMLTLSWNEQCIDRPSQARDLSNWSIDRSPLDHSSLIIALQAECTD